MKLMRQLIRYLRGTRGVAAMEYALIVGVIVVGVSTAAVTFRNQITTFFTSMGTQITTATATATAT